MAAEHPGPDPLSEEIIEDLKELITHRSHLWLLGAGASLASKLPLIVGLTACVRARVTDIPINLGPTVFKDAKPKTVGEVINGVCKEIGLDATIESVLDHLGDYMAMAKRSIFEVHNCAAGSRWLCRDGKSAL